MHNMADALAWLLFGVSLLGAVRPVHATGPDGWLISLDWTPQYCRDHPGSKEAQCREELYFVLGGLQPVFQNASAKCSDDKLSVELLDQARVDVPNRAKVQRMWSRDGRCSGLSPEAYVLELGRASRRWAPPPELRRVPPDLRMTPSELRSAFLRVNPELRPEQLVPQCRRRHFSAALFCVDADFQPVACGPKVVSKCGESFAIRGFSARQLQGVD